MLHVTSFAFRIYMNSHQYLKWIKKTLPLQDYLSASRTILSNERTFLSYFRSALTAMIAGVSFIKFLEQAILQLLGWFLVFFSIVLFIYGLGRYEKMRQQIIKMETDEAKMLKKQKHS